MVRATREEIHCPKTESLGDNTTQEERVLFVVHEIIYRGIKFCIKIVK